jgi:hypothetical protein
MKELITNITNPPKINHVVTTFYGNLQKIIKLSTMKHRNCRSRNVLHFHQVCSICISLKENPNMFFPTHVPLVKFLQPHDTPLDVGMGKFY